MKHQSPTIVLTGGGSGGHITPLLSLAHELKNLDPNCQIVYIGHKGDQFDNISHSTPDFDFVSFINGGKFRRYHGEGLASHLLDIKTLALNARDFFRVLRSIATSARILRKVRPDVVFSKGGFVAVPVGIAARMLKIPIITHDSDTVPGLANRIIGKWARINATGMPVHYYSYPSQKKIHTGIPINPSIKPVTTASQKKIKTDLKLPQDSQVLLIAGGGHGSKTINQALVDVMPKLLSSNLSLYAVHVAGQDHEAAVTAAYQRLLGPNELKRVRVGGYFKDFYLYSSAADLIVGRAGATSLAEYALEGKACIIIPSPFLAGGHQLKNAEQMSNSDAAVVVPNDVSSDELLVVITELLSNDARRLQLARNLSAHAKPGASAELARIIIAIARGPDYGR